MASLITGRIYIIRSPNTEMVYVGSTIQTLRNRFYRHKAPTNDSSSKIIIDEGDATIELLEEVQVENERELRFHEQQYLELYKHIAVNEYFAFGVDEERKKETYKKFYEEHKEKIIEYTKQYRLKNPEDFKKRCKEFHQKNKERLNKKSQEFRDKNKDVNIKCPCGSVFAKYSKSHHLKSQKHQKYLEENVDQEIRDKNKDMKIECPCGSVIAKYSKSLHLKSKKHQKYLENVAQE
jgi:hypothetical protein